jgi:hypothetical protein
MLHAAGRLRLLPESFDFPRMQTMAQSSIDTDDSPSHLSHFADDPMRAMSTTELDAGCLHGTRKRGPTTSSTA